VLLAISAAGRIDVLQTKSISARKPSQNLDIKFPGRYIVFLTGCLQIIAVLAMIRLVWQKRRCCDLRKPIMNWNAI
jgi:hypothetical protein